MVCSKDGNGTCDIIHLQVSQLAICGCLTSMLLLLWGGKTVIRMIYNILHRLCSWVKLSRVRWHLGLHVIIFQMFPICIILLWGPLIIVVGQDNHILIRIIIELLVVSPTQRCQCPRIYGFHWVHITLRERQLLGMYPSQIFQELLLLIRFPFNLRLKTFMTSFFMNFEGLVNYYVIR
jgi:hypothetical protein